VAGDVDVKLQSRGKLNRKHSTQRTRTYPHSYTKHEETELTYKSVYIKHQTFHRVHFQHTKENYLPHYINKYINLRPKNWNSGPLYSEEKKNSNELVENRIPVSIP